MAIFLLSSCSLGGSTDSDAKAKLDYANNDIVMPLDEYTFSEKDQNVMNKAEVRAIEECMSTKGIAVVPTDFDETLSGDRTYFQWNDEAAKKETEFMSGTSAKNAASTYNDPAQDQVREACRTEKQQQIASMGLSESEASSVSLGSELQDQASQEAKKDGQWKNIKEDWYKCIEDKGLTRSGDDWASAEVMDLQGKGRNDAQAAAEMVRVSLIESRCSQDTGAVQKLADIEASYQTPLIEKNQAQLNEQKQTIDTKIQAAEAYLAQHG